MDYFGAVAGLRVGLYMPIRGELDTAPLAGLLRAAGAELLLPAVIDSSGPLVFRSFVPGEELRAGYGRIPEPHADAPIRTPDILIVPLAAFDRRGFRIGYGKGHYDRTLSALGAQTRAVGYAFALQEVDTVPDEPHDHPLEAIVTERGVRQPHRIAERHGTSGE